MNRFWIYSNMKNLLIFSTKINKSWHERDRKERSVLIPTEYHRSTMDCNFVCMAFLFPCSKQTVVTFRAAWYEYRYPDGTIVSASMGRPVLSHVSNCELNLSLVTDSCWNCWYWSESSRNCWQKSLSVAPTKRWSGGDVDDACCCKKCHRGKSRWNKEAAMYRPRITFAPGCSLQSDDRLVYPVVLKKWRVGWMFPSRDNVRIPGYSRRRGMVSLVFSPQTRRRKWILGIMLSTRLNEYTAGYRIMMRDAKESSMALKYSTFCCTLAKDNPRIGACAMTVFFKRSLSCWSHGLKYSKVGRKFSDTLKPRILEAMAPTR